ncbi:unnamed protein product, partial [marine sediment metagenome]
TDWLTLAEIQALDDGSGTKTYGEYDVQNIKIAIGEGDTWPEAETVYIDDIEINGVLYPLELKGTQEGEELTVSGTGVTAGTNVNIYWNYVSAAYLMDT